MSDLRPKQILKEIGRRWPQSWQQVKSFRAGKGKDLPDWPDWCYIPVAAGVAIATQGIDSRLQQAMLDPKLSPAVITAAAAWRITQGVYRFDADLYNSLVSQSFDGNIPCEILKRLPEWCIYIETYNASFSNEPIVGFWSHLEHDTNDGRMELRLVLMLENEQNLSVPIHLGNWALAEGLERMKAEATKYILPSLKITPEQIMEVDIIKDIEPLLQLVLYLCAENADIPEIQHPQNRVRMSGQVDIARQPNLWNVGERIGAGIRKYRNQEWQGGQDSMHARPRPHIRKAHYHHFWTGPKDGERKLILRWLPPIPVGIGTDAEGEMPAVIHKIK